MRKNFKIFLRGIILLIIIFALLGIIFLLLIPKEQRSIEAYLSYSAAGVAISLIASLVFYCGMKYAGTDAIDNLESKYNILIKAKELGITDLFSSVESVPDGAAQFYKNMLEYEPKELCLLGVSNYKWFGDPGRSEFRNALKRVVSERKLNLKILFLNPESNFLGHKILHDKKEKIEKTIDNLRKIKEDIGDIIIGSDKIRRQDEEKLQIKMYDSLPSLHIIKCEGLKRLYIYHYCRPSIKDEQSPLLIEISKQVNPKMFDTFNCHLFNVWEKSEFIV